MNQKFFDKSHLIKVCKLMLDINTAAPCPPPPFSLEEGGGGNGKPKGEGDNWVAPCPPQHAPLGVQGRKRKAKGGVEGGTLY